MPTNTHTTATVRLQLDLTGLISQLRELADTLEATMATPTAPDMDDEPEPVCTCPETAECRHEAWEVDRRAITRKCADCGAPLPPMPEADDDHEPEPVCTCPETTLAERAAAYTTLAGYEPHSSACHRSGMPENPEAWELWQWQGSRARHERPAPTTTPLAEALRWKAGQ